MASGPCGVSLLRKAPRAGGKAPVRAGLRRPARWLLPLAALAMLALAAPGAARAQMEPETAPDQEGSLDDVLAAVVRVESRIPPDARTAPILGTERAGSGVLIGEDGEILTIGYLILEAEQVRVTTEDGMRMPATVLGYDPKSGLGLVRTLEPIAARPVPLGVAADVREQDPLLIVLGQGEERVHSVVLVSHRVFAGYWEYLLDRALFTIPPVQTFSGVALLNKNLELVGIGSLFVRDASEGRDLPGNMFVPVDAVRPVLSDLARMGRPATPARPWLGVLVHEFFDHVVITRVRAESPAERAGLGVGDIVVEVAGRPVASMEGLYREMWKLGNAGIDVPLKVLQRNHLRDVTVQSIDRLAYYRNAAR